jgi:hypothetical protein
LAILKEDLPLLLPPSTQTTTAAPKPSRVPLTLMLMAIY